MEPKQTIIFRVQINLNSYLSERRRLFFFVNLKVKGHRELISNFLPTPTPSHWLLLLPLLTT